MLLLRQVATWPPLVKGVESSRLTFPKQGGPNAATESLLAGGIGLSTSAIPQFWPPSSLDDRRVPILDSNVKTINPDF